VKPFLSSTFKDMKAERKHLRERIFPQLRDSARQSGGDFSPIDLQWVRTEPAGAAAEGAVLQGVTSDDEAKGKVIFNCLHYINGTRPFFICLLGERSVHPHTAFLVADLLLGWLGTALTDPLRCSRCISPRRLSCLCRASLG